MKRYSIFFIAITILFFPSFSHAATYGITRPTNMLGLVGWWTFDGKDIVNGLMTDKSGNGSNANFKNIASSTFYAQGKIGQGGNFDGTDDYLTWTTSALDNLSTVTACGWIYQEDYQPNQYTDIFSNYGPPTGGWDLYTAGNGRGLGTSVGGGGYDQLNDAGLVPKKWYHLCATQDGNNDANFKLYVNAVEVIGINSGGAATRDPVNSNTARIGKDPNPGTEFKGKIDDVRIYSRALSATEIKALYSQGASTKQSSSPTTQSINNKGINAGLVGYWTFDGRDIVNGLMTDKSGNGNNGLFQNISTSTFYKQGKIGQGGSFDGLDDKVNITAASSINNLSTITACAWVKPTKFLTADQHGGGWYPPILSKYDDTSQSGWDLYLEDVGLDNLNWGVGTSIRNSGGQYSFAEYRDGSISNGKWSQICVSQNGNSGTNIKLYTNGVEVTPGDVDSSGTRGDDSANPFIISPIFSVSPYYNGMVDEVRLYNRVLSATEIKQLYNMGK